MDFEEQRKNLVQELRENGIREEKVLAAVGEIPREKFISVELDKVAYDNAPLPIGFDQTISQPYVVAHMLEHLKLSEHDRLLEVGAGSGYAAAVASELVDRVYAVEIQQELYSIASGRLKRMGYSNIEMFHGDGHEGLPEHAPFTKILVSACGEEIPPALIDQLAVGGRLVAPVEEEDRDWQRLVVLDKASQTDIRRWDAGKVRFVPLRTNLEGESSEN